MEEFLMSPNVKDYIKQNANIPNLLTLLRIILIPVYWHYFIVYPSAVLERFIIFVAASVTDALDGYIARKYHQITDLGKLFDPLADKLMVTSVLLSQYMAGVLPLLPILIMLGKDVLLIIGSAFLLKKKLVVYANIWGKAATVSFMLSLALSFFHTHLTARYDIILLWISVALSLVAFLSYLIRAIQYMKQN